MRMRRVQLLRCVVLGVLLAVAGAACPSPTPPGAPTPKWFRRPVPGALSRHWVYDGISPFTPYAIKVQGNSMKMPLVGRGTENPLKQDPFGAGLRISTANAWLAGRLSATIRIPNPTSGTIFAMYLIDVHPKGSERGGSRWREADLEWLGLKPGQVQTSVFEVGQEQPHAEEHDLKALLGVTQRDPVRYTIDWELRPGMKKAVRFSAASGSKSVLIREWTPPNAEVASFWNEPLRAIFTFWSNRHIAHWSGAYSLPAGEMLWVDVADVAFVPRGSPYCPTPDLDLQPSAE